MNGLSTCERPALAVSLGPVRLKNPVAVASGCYGYGGNYREFYDPSRLGGIFLKCVTPAERPGNAPQRLVETPSGLLNAIGLQNVGIERFLREIVPAIEGIDTAFFANIGADDLDGYAMLARRLSDVPKIAAIELNISCPNVKKGCLAFGADPESARQATQAAVQSSRLPVFVKLSPNVANIGEMAQAVAEGGAAGITAINTLLGMAIDVETRRPKLANVTGGLSGPAIRPVAVRMVWEIRKAVPDLPLIGMGGILTWRDAIEFLLAGANAIAIGTGNFVNPMAPMDVLQGIEDYMAQHGFASVAELSGAMEG
ncbi:MAG: dihydroorotate dehydrogenase [Candidatus Sumerlaeota bacterium]|nr:dihydroorotate dehydrogenase [Candidatus Sumerlaeota bacterium]